MFRKGNVGWQLLAIAIAATLLAGCQDQQETRQLTMGGPVEVEVETVHPQEAVIEMELSGRTAAFRVAEVRPQVNGIIEKRLFTEGSEVAAGDLLYQIDAAVYQAKLDSAQATLAKAEAVEHSARVKAERYSSLVKTKSVSELDQVEIEAAWRQAQAEVAQAKAALNSARIDLEHTRVTAPISGRIGKSEISEGALVTAQQSSPLAVIQQLDPLYVDVTQSSSEMLRLKKNLAAGIYANTRQPKPQVKIILEDGSFYDLEGTLEFSDATVEPTTGTVTLRTIVANPVKELLPGMFVRARVVSGTQENAILVPAASVIRNSRGEATVMLVDNESKVESRLITSGGNIGNKVLVETGLKAGEVLITSGLQKIRPGVPVKGVSPSLAMVAAMGTTTGADAGVRE